MSHILRLVRGNSTLELANGSNYQTWEYNPQPPSATLAQILNAVSAGTDGTITVTEPLRMMVRGDNKAEARQYVNLLETRMMEAEQYATTRQGVPVYLHLQMDGLQAAERTQILSGRWVPDDLAMVRWAANAIEGTLYITRRFYWERAIETAIRLRGFAASAGAVGVLTGQLINNHTNTGAGNFVEIASGIAPTVIPAPLRIELTNRSTTSRIYSNIYMANSVMYSNDDRLSDMIQGENQIATGSGAAEANLTGNSGSAVLAVEFTGVAAPAWQYSSSAVQGAAGRSYRLFARIPWYTNITNNVIYLRPQLVQSATSAADLNPYAYEVSLPTISQNELNDLGVLSFGDYPGGEQLALRIAMRSAAAVRVEFDWLQALPAENFRHLVYRGTGLAQDESIVDNPIEGRAFELNSSSRQLPVVNAKGNPLMLWPDTGYHQRIYVLVDRNGQAPVNEMLWMRAWYRSRRLTI